MRHVNTRPLVVVALGLSVVMVGHGAEQGAGDMDQRVAALKQSIAESQARLRKYEWVETTIVSVKGEEKDRKQQRCYYGADGKVQKELLSDEKAAAPSGGRRMKQKIVANKTSEMRDYMESAAALVHQYVPPNPTSIDSVKQRGKLALKPGQGGRVRLELGDYLKPGDMMAIDLDPAANALVGLNVNTYLDTPQDAVTLAVVFGALPDGASYTAQTTLDAKAKNITVVIQNSGHRPVGQ